MDIFINFILDNSLYFYTFTFLFSFCLSFLKRYFFRIEKIFILFVSFLAGIHVLNLWYVIFTLILGSLIWDLIVFFLWKNNWRAIVKFLWKKDKKTALKFLKENSLKSFFLAKTLNIYPSLVQFLWGYKKFSLKNFLKYNVLWIFIEILWWVIFGYFLGIYFNFFENKIIFFWESFSIIIIFFLILFLYFYKKLKGKMSLKKIKYIINLKKRQIIKILLKTTFYNMVFVVFLYFLILYFMFFIFDNTATINKKFSIYNSIEEIKKDNQLLTYFQKENNLNRKKYQPINIIIISSKDISTILKEIGWIKTSMFWTDKINLWSFLKNMKNKKLPISNMYLNGLVQWYAFQNKSNSLRKREHVRFWKVWYFKNYQKKVYMWSITKDIWIDLTLYRGFWVPLHEINPNIDKSREFFLKILKKHQNNIEYQYIDWSDKINDTEYFYTDWKILFIKI